MNFVWVNTVYSEVLQCWDSSRTAHLEYEYNTSWGMSSEVLTSISSYGNTAPIIAGTLQLQQTMTSLIMTSPQMYQCIVIYPDTD
ncbi:hypothetical protein J6590_042444 [Homalodisca vitripennis]|nr:hypothetical protein J6590_042444 [Homalodisca vitripennis]